LNYKADYDNNLTRLTQRIERLLHQTVSALVPIHRGYTPALRLRVMISNGSSVFAKVATTPLPADWLRKEHKVYQFISDTFLPALLGWEDDENCPMLFLEDLSAAIWPPPWTPVQIERVQDTLTRVASKQLSAIPRLIDRSEIILGWQPVAEDPTAFLSLGLVSEKWLVAALPRLLEANGLELMDGNALLHTDVRSNNLFFLGERTVLVDWN
jgi:hypothetical protein